MVVFARSSLCLITKHATRATLALAFACASIPAQAEVLFEGYSKILLGGKHVGFTVQRFEFDPKKKEFSTIYYLKTTAEGGNITESLKARSTANLNPVSYQYTELQGTNPRTIDVTFKGDKMSGTTLQGGQKKAIALNGIPKGSFLASFLGYLMLQGKEGIKTGVKYGYKAIAEEDGNLYAGEAYIAGEEKIQDIQAFRVLNTYKGSQYVSFVTHKGEVLGTRSPAQQISTELVGSIQEATVGIPVNSQSLTQLFGAVPKGVDNVIARKRPGQPLGVDKSAAPLATSEEKPSKQNRLEATPTPSEKSPKLEGVPAGQGITVKGAPEQEATPTPAPSASSKAE